MKFSRLKRVDTFEVEQWLKENLDLTDSQYRRMSDDERIRFSGFIFYKRKPIKKYNILWRLTAPVFLLYCLLMIIIVVPLKWIITGNRYLSQKFLDSFHYRWEEKFGW